MNQLYSAEITLIKVASELELIPRKGQQPHLALSQVDTSQGLIRASRQTGRGAEVIGIPSVPKEWPF